jgi:hypothetical protein
MVVLRKSIKSNTLWSVTFILPRTPLCVAEQYYLMKKEITFIAIALVWAGKCWSPNLDVHGNVQVCARQVEG